MLNIFYCHGFASAFNPVKPKIQCLSELGPVHGINFDFMQPAETLVERCIAALLEHDIDLLVGTSMGGWLANVAGSRAGLPFVAINPAIEPSRTLMRHVGKGVDHQGRPYDLEASAVLSYSPFRLEGCGLILLDEGDEVLDSAQIASLCKPGLWAGRRLIQTRKTHVRHHRRHPWLCFRAESAPRKDGLPEHRRRLATP
ncbi:MAG: hypothetical protein CME36_19735 [unclassified Hahellaceae]|nr:hypothetical protein [Hahellaceae bacterium]